MLLGGATNTKDNKKKTQQQNKDTLFAFENTSSFTFLHQSSVMSDVINNWMMVDHLGEPCAVPLGELGR